MATAIRSLGQHAGTIPDAEWWTRFDLAAFYRLLALYDSSSPTSRRAIGPKHHRAEAAQAEARRQPPLAADSRRSIQGLLWGSGAAPGTTRIPASDQ